MNWQSVSFDWNQARAFLVIAEEGTLSAAARALDLTQPTLSRQVAALEQELGVILFNRNGRTFSLTPTGLSLLEHFRAMGEAAARISLASSGQSQAIEGEVTITASDTFSAYWLPPVLRRLRETAPGIEVEVVASNEVRDLQRREADIAIRHVRPEQPDLIARLVRETEAHLYASKRYLAEYGRPTCTEDLAGAAFIGFSPVERFRTVLAAHGLAISRRNIKAITNNGVVMCEMVNEGLGIGVMTKDHAARFPGLERVLPEFAPIPVPIWLTTHRELHTSRRIRVVFDLLAEILA